MIFIEALGYTFLGFVLCAITVVIAAYIDENGYEIKEMVSSIKENVKKKFRKKEKTGVTNWKKEIEGNK